MRTKHERKETTMADFINKTIGNAIVLAIITALVYVVMYCI